MALVVHGVCLYVGLSAHAVCYATPAPVAMVEAASASVPAI